LSGYEVTSYSEQLGIEAQYSRPFSIVVADLLLLERYLIGRSGSSGGPTVTMTRPLTLLIR
jgi:hypothetical protein